MAAPILLTKEDVGRRLAAVYEAIGPELAEAEAVFAAELESRFAFVQGLVDHCADFKGKRLRPTLVLLTAQACGGIRPEHPTLAAVVEMIHTATLVHDDILDEAMVRRHAATVNAEWGNEAAVLMGDYLFTHAFHLAASLETTLACRWIGRATNLVCEGEMQQVHNRGNVELDEAAYFEIIRGKTAELTAVSCRLGAHYAGRRRGDGRGAGRLRPRPGRRLPDRRRRARPLGRRADDRQEPGHRPREAEADAAADPPPEHGRHGTGHAGRGMLAEPVAETRRELRPYLESSGALDYAWQQATAYARRAAGALDHPARNRGQRIAPQPEPVRRPPPILRRTRLARDVTSVLPTVPGHSGPGRRTPPTRDCLTPGRGSTVSCGSAR